MDKTRFIWRIRKWRLETGIGFGKGILCHRNTPCLKHGFHFDIYTVISTSIMLVRMSTTQARITKGMRRMENCLIFDSMPASIQKNKMAGFCFMLTALCSLLT